MNFLPKQQFRTSFSLHRFLHSVRFRLTLWFVAILALILSVFSIFIFTRQAQILRTTTINRLSTQSRQLEAYYLDRFHDIFEDEHKETEPLRLPAVNLPLLEEHDVMALISSRGETVQSVGDIQASDLENILEKWDGSQTQPPPISYLLPGQETPVLFQLTPIDFEDEWEGVLVLGSQVDPTEQLSRLAISLIIGSVFILVLAFGGGYWLADRAMHPVQIITHTAHQISESDLNQRLRLDTDDELGELANTFDEMLDRLQGAFERQRRFTADASHELRTPLTIIELESSRALERARSTEEYVKAMQLIHSENEWMSLLVQELLTLARIDAGQLVLHPERVNLSDLALDVTDRLMPLARASWVTLAAGNLDDAWVTGDRVYLSQMITNLLENGIKYAKGETARVLIETGSGFHQGKPAGYVRVKDNGPGIHPEHIPHLFDRFYRIEEARSKDEESKVSTASGVGLGLAIAQSIAQAFGGLIVVESEIGKGASFSAWLPENA